MKRIILIGCGKKKKEERAKAAELYTSDFFVEKLAYACSQKPDAIYILSAMHGLVDLDEEMDPYCMVLTRGKAKEWAKGVSDKLENITKERTGFTLLAGKEYFESLRCYLKHAGHVVAVPMEGLGIGKQRQWLKRNTPGQSRAWVKCLLQRQQFNLLACKGVEVAHEQVTFLERARAIALLVSKKDPDGIYEIRDAGKDAPVLAPAQIVQTGKKIPIGNIPGCVVVAISPGKVENISRAILLLNRMRVISEYAQGKCTDGCDGVDAYPEEDGDWEEVKKAWQD